MDKIEVVFEEKGIRVFIPKDLYTNNLEYFNAIFREFEDEKKLK